MKKGNVKMQYTVSHKNVAFLLFFFPRTTIKFHFVCIFRFITFIKVTNYTEPERTAL